MSRTHEVYPNHTDEQAANCPMCGLEDRMAQIYERLIRTHLFEYATLIRDAWCRIPRRLPSVEVQKPKSGPLENEYPEKMQAFGSASYGCVECHKQGKKLIYCRECKRWVCPKCTSKPIKFKGNRCVNCKRWEKHR